MLCGPWLNAADVTWCAVPTDPPELAKLERAVKVATYLVWRASGRLYDGICSDVVRPCHQGPAIQQLDYPWGTPRPINVMAGCGCGGSDLACGCNAHPNVKLPGAPIIGRPVVTIDGVPFDGFTIVDSQWLVRSDGASWPCCQNLGLLATEPGTWQVSYRYGRAVPPDLLLAMEVVACELVAGWCVGDDCGPCRLPEKVVSATYEGATYQMADPFALLEGGRFGIPEVDHAIRSVNPNGLQRTGRAISPRDFLARTHRVR